MEILLTQSDRDKIYYSDPVLYGDNLNAWDEAICRAQVNRVVEERQAALDGPCPMGDTAACPWGGHDNEALCRTCKASHFFAIVEQALRKAGGGE